MDSLAEDEGSHQVPVSALVGLTGSTPLAQIQEVAAGEMVNYLGYSNSHQTPVCGLLLEEALTAR